MRNDVPRRPDRRVRQPGRWARARRELCIATWQSLLADEWLVVPGSIQLRHAEFPPEADPGAPDMFAQSDPGLLAPVLTTAGFTDIDTTPHEFPFALSRSVDEAVDYLTGATSGDDWSRPGRSVAMIPSA